MIDPFGRPVDEVGRRFIRDSEGGEFVGGQPHPSARYCPARVRPGPRPTLPPGGRMGDVSHRTNVLSAASASQRSTDGCAHPGSGAALCSSVDA